MFRVFGVPPTSEYAQFKENDPSYKPSPEELSAKLFFNSRKEGYVLFSDGTLSQLFTTTTLEIPFKNKIINGDFIIWQRGTSAIGITSSGYYTADRWGIGINSGSVDQTHELIGVEYFLKATIATPPNLITSTNYIVPFAQNILYTYLLDFWASKFTKYFKLSFLFYSSVNGDFSVVFSIYEPDSNNYYNYGTTFNYSSSPNPQHITITIPNPSLPTPTSPGFLDPKSIMGSIGAVLYIAGISGGDPSITHTSPGSYVTSSSPLKAVSTATDWTSVSGNYVGLGKVRLFYGEADFQDYIVPYDLELYRCRMFYEKSYPIGMLPSQPTAYGAVSESIPTSGTGIYKKSVHFSVEKRGTLPSIVTYGTITGASGTIVVDGVEVPATIENPSSRGFTVYWNDTISSKSSIEFQWVADAESYFFL